MQNNWNGKKKALTFSYDDGVLQDIRLIELFNKYGMKATFNLNSEKLGKPGALIREEKHVDHTKVKAADVRHIYEGHEVAVHTLTHPHLENIESDEDVIREIEEDRLRLSELCGYEVVGMAYPFGTYDERVVRLMREHTGVRYARTVRSTHDFFAPQSDLLTFHPTVYHHAEWDTMLALGEKFLSLSPDEPALFYVWGHAYEFDIHDDWARFEDFLRMMAGKADIFYGTNAEVLL